MKVFLLTAFLVFTSFAWAGDVIRGCAEVLQESSNAINKTTNLSKSVALLSHREQKALWSSVDASFEASFKDMVVNYYKIIQRLEASNDKVFQFFARHGAHFSKGQIKAPSLVSIFEEVKKRPKETMLTPVFPVKIKEGPNTFIKYIEYGSAFFTDGSAVKEPIKLNQFFSGTLLKEDYIELLANGFLPLSSPESTSDGLEQGALVHDLAHVVILLNHPEMAVHLFSGAKELFKDRDTQANSEFSPINRLWDRMAEFNEWHSVIEPSAYGKLLEVLNEKNITLSYNKIKGKTAVTVKEVRSKINSLSFFKKRNLRLQVLYLLESSMVHYGGGSADGISRNLENYFYRDDVVGTPYSVYLALKNKKDERSLARAIALIYGFSQVSVGEVTKEAFSLVPDTSSFVNYLYSGLGLFNSDTQGLFLNSENYNR